MANKSLQHFGVMGMHWGQHKSQMTQNIISRSNKVLDNPKSTDAQISKALSDIGVDPKTGKSKRTEPVYDKNGRDVSVNPFTRLGKRKGQSDKAFDDELQAEFDADARQAKAEAFIRKQKGLPEPTVKSELIYAGKLIVGSLAAVAVSNIIGNKIGNMLAQKAIEIQLKKLGLDKFGLKP